MAGQSSSRFDAFLACEPERRERIIQAALAEFVEKGFKLASTNAIASNAQIGKGMLFYYFGSKEELFDFLCEYTVEFIRREFLDRFDENTRDFIERQRRLAVAKRQVMERKPLMFALFETFFDPKNAEYTLRLTDTLAAYQDEFMHKLYDGADASLFRTDIHPRNTMRYITWLLDRYTGEAEERLTASQLEIWDANEWTKFDAFIDDLKKLFYR